MTDEEEALAQAREGLQQLTRDRILQLERDIRLRGCSNEVVPLIITSAYMANAPETLQVFKLYAESVAAADQSTPELISENIGTVGTGIGVSLLALEGSRALAGSTQGITGYLGHTLRGGMMRAGVSSQSVLRFARGSGLRAVPYIGTAVGVSMSGFEVYQGVHELDAHRAARGASEGVGFIGGCAAGAAITHWAGSWVPLLGNAVAGAIGCVGGGILGSIGANALEEQLDIADYFQEGFDEERNEMLDALDAELRSIIDAHAETFVPLVSYEAAYQDWFEAYNNNDSEAMLRAENQMQEAFDGILGNDLHGPNTPGMPQADLDHLQAIGANLYDQLNVLSRIAAETDPNNQEAMARLEEMSGRVIDLSHAAQYLLYAQQNWTRYNGQYREQFTAEHNYLIAQVLPCLHEGHEVELNPIMYSPDEMPLNENMFVLPHPPSYSMQL